MNNQEIINKSNAFNVLLKRTGYQSQDIERAEEETRAIYRLSIREAFELDERVLDALKTSSDIEKSRVLQAKARNLSVCRSVKTILNFLKFIVRFFRIIKLHKDLNIFGSKKDG